MFATVASAAEGDIMNDYLDVKIDRINRPVKIIIGEKLSK